MDSSELGQSLSPQMVQKQAEQSQRESKEAGEGAYLQPLQSEALERLANFTIKVVNSSSDKSEEGV